LETIEHGYDLEFETIPIQEHPPKQIIWSEHGTECIQLEVKMQYVQERSCDHVTGALLGPPCSMDLLVPLTIDIVLICVQAW
jgi:hypothetical protein